MIDLICTALHQLAALRKTPGELVRRHIHAPDLHLYVRMGPRLCGDTMLRALVLADITVQEDKRRQGLFSGLLARLEQETAALDMQALVVENVGNPHLSTYLLKQGYKPTGPYLDTLYKECKPND